MTCYDNPNVPANVTTWISDEGDKIQIWQTRENEETSDKQKSKSDDNTSQQKLPPPMCS